MTRAARILLATSTVLCGTAALWCLGVYLRAQSAIDAARQARVAGSAALPTYKFLAPVTTRPSRQGPTVRVAVIGGMVETGFWQTLSDRYEHATGVHVELIAAGPKTHLENAFKQRGGIDLITMHASDTIMNLVADGYCMDPQPWMRNDQVIVGPHDDPAQIRALTDAAEALRRIAAAHSPFVVHSSVGTQEVLHNLLETQGISLDPATVTQLFVDNQRNVLHIAAEKHAYTLVGRIPFRSGKLPNEGLEYMVGGDPRLRRPFVVAVSNPVRVLDARPALARQFAAWLRGPATQAWIAEFGRGSLDDQPLFFPVELDTGHTSPDPRP